jgi:hypothetical protein
VQNQLVGLKAKRAQLAKDTALLRDVDRTLDTLNGQSAQLEQAVLDRGYWTRLLAVMNNKFENDYLWLTQIVIDKNGAPLVPAPGANGGASTQAQSTQPPKPPVKTTGAVAAQPALPSYELHVQGLYRKVEGSNGPQVVYKYFDDLKTATEFFSATADKPDAKLGLEDDRYAYQFSFHLPLAPGMKFEK